MRTVLIRKWGLSLLMSTMAGGAAGQHALEQYVREGLSDNLVLQQRNVSLERAEYALKSARSLYLPSVNLQAGYQTASGGRNIPLPIGDMLNPVYTTLNQLTQTDQFPQIRNETINFLPKNYYDAHVRATMPLLNTELGHNKRIQQGQLRLSELELNTYKRELVKEIKVAYYNYLSAVQAVDIYRSALDLATEGRRTNQKLVDNGKGLPAYVLRSEGEVAAASAQLTEALVKTENARLYFNCLLNRPQDAQIDTAFDRRVAMSNAARLISLPPADGEEREELQSLETVIGIQETTLKMNRQFTIPKLSAFVDVGSQSEGFHFNNQTQYYLIGLQLDFPIFNGNRNKYKIQQSRLDTEEARLRLRDTEQQLALSASVAANRLRSAWDAYESARTQLEAAAAYQRLISRGYQAGTNSYIETVDARSQYTSARIAAVIRQYEVLSAAAAVEREQATYPLTQ
jgi:Outer membrane protein